MYNMPFGAAGQGGERRQRVSEAAWRSPRHVEDGGGAPNRFRSIEIVRRWRMILAVTIMLSANDDYACQTHRHVL